MRALFGALCVAALAVGGSASAVALEEMSTEALMVGLGIDPVPYRGYSEFVEGTPAEAMLKKLSIAVGHLNDEKAEKSAELKKQAKQCKALEADLHEALKPVVKKIMAVEREKHALMLRAHTAQRRAEQAPRRVAEAEDRVAEVGRVLEVHKAAEAAARAMRAATRPGVSAQQKLVTRSRDQLETVLASAANALDLLRQRVERAKEGLKMIHDMKVKKEQENAAKAGASLLEVSAAGNAPDDAELRAMVAEAEKAVTAVEQGLLRDARRQGEALALAEGGLSRARAEAVVENARKSVAAAAAEVAAAEAATAGRPAAAAAAARVAEAAAADTEAWRGAAVRLLARLFENVEDMADSAAEGKAVDAAEAAIVDDAKKSHAAFAEAEAALEKIKVQARKDKAFARSLVKEHLQPMHDRACALRDEREALVGMHAKKIDACHERAEDARAAVRSAEAEIASAEKRESHILRRLKRIHEALGFHDYEPEKHVVKAHPRPAAGAAPAPGGLDEAAAKLAKHAPLFEKLDGHIAEMEEAAPTTQLKKKDAESVNAVNAFFKSTLAKAKTVGLKHGDDTKVVSKELVAEHEASEKHKAALEAIVEDAVAEALAGSEG